MHDPWIENNGVRIAWEGIGYRVEGGKKGKIGTIVIL